MCDTLDCLCGTKVSRTELKGTKNGKYEKLRWTNLEWGVDFLRLTNLVKTS